MLLLLLWIWWRTHCVQTFRNYALKRSSGDSMSGRPHSHASYCSYNSSPCLRGVKNQKDFCSTLLGWWTAALSDHDTLATEHGLGPGYIGLLLWVTCSPNLQTKFPCLLEWCDDGLSRLYSRMLVATSVLNWCMIQSSRSGTIVAFIAMAPYIFLCSVNVGLDWKYHIDDIQPGKNVHARPDPPGAWFTS